MVLLTANLPVLVQCVSLALIIGLGCYICDVAAKFVGIEDPGIVVWDEIAGVLCGDVLGAGHCCYDLSWLFDFSYIRHLKTLAHFYGGTFFIGRCWNYDG